MCQHNLDTARKYLAQTFAVESFLELEPPHSLRLVHLKHSETDDEDKNGGNK